MPKQNRPLVRDGRLQAKKKRTDRSYLSPAAPASEPAEAPPALESTVVDDTAASETEGERDLATSTTRASSAAAARLPSSVRAIQQQGVRKRRELDVSALAERDSRYAFHELRRIAILTTLVIVTLVVLAIVLR